MRVGILELSLWGATEPWVQLRDIACAGEHRRNSLCVTWRKVRRLGTPTKGPCRTAWRDLHSPRLHRNGSRLATNLTTPFGRHRPPGRARRRRRPPPNTARRRPRQSPRACPSARSAPARSPSRVPRGAPAEAVHHRGFDDPGAHGVDAEVQRRVVEGRRLGEADDAEFRGAVRGLTGDAFDPGARRRCSRSPHPLA